MNPQSAINNSSVRTPVGAQFFCSHCGLPVSDTLRRGGRLYCCYGCYIASRMVGSRGGGTLQAWQVLRLGLGAFLAMDVMMVALLIYTGSVEEQYLPAFRWLMLGLSAPAMAILAWPFVAGSWGEWRRRAFSLDTLIAMGSLTAFGLSAASTIRGRGELYFDTATMLLVLVTAGKLMEASAKRHAGEMLEQLSTMLPPTAMRQERDEPPASLSAGPQYREVPLALLRAGDRVLVRPGARLPVDGVIVEGHTSIHEAAFTGEWQLRSCGPGDEVFAGTVNGISAIVVQARAVGADLLLCRIVEQVRLAQVAPSRTQRLSAQAARLMVPGVLLLAGASALAWWAAGRPSEALAAALSVLVVACPCAMGIAAPLATAVGIAQAARRGVLVRDGAALENAGNLRQLYFDKTGTLTQGLPMLTHVECVDDRCEEPELLAALAALECSSEHVLAQAVRARAAAAGVTVPRATQVQNLPGLGVRGTVYLHNGPVEALAGNEDLLRQCEVLRIADCEELRNANCGLRISPSENQFAIRNLPAGQAGSQFAMSSVVHIAWGGRARGFATFSDAPRAEAAEVVRELEALGVEAAVVSGDGMAASRELADKLGIRRVYAPCSVQDKVRLLAAGRDGPAGMVGDGVNDAPALAAADVGIAMGGGTDLAQHAGSVVLVGGDLRQIPCLVRLGRQVRRVVKQNLWWAAGYNAVALTAAAAGLLHPLLAALAMVASSISVLTNSLRLGKS